LAPPARTGGKRLSLRGQALAHLSRREYSRQELRTKLLGGFRRRRSEDEVLDDEADRDGDGLGDRPALDPPPAPPTEAEVDALLDWLEAKGYLSDARFIESRLHARSERHGSLRIHQELARHGLAMSDEQSAQLRETELARARELWLRKFGEVAAEPRERARQARFLAARGFPADVVRRIVGGEPDE
jgi:regulatory protein